MTVESPAKVGVPEQRPTPTNEATTTATQQPQMPRYTPKEHNMVHNSTRMTSTVHDSTVHHQSSRLQFVYNHISNQWYFKGETTLYLTSYPPESSSSSTNTSQQSNNGSNSKSTATDSNLQTNNNKNNNNNNNTSQTSTAGTSNTLSSPNTSGGNKHSSQQKREIALHFRGGNAMSITSVQLYSVLPTHNNSKNGSSIIHSDNHHDTKDKITSGDSTTNTDIMAISSEIDQSQKEEEEIEKVTIQPLDILYKTHVDPLAKILTKPCQTFTPLDYYYIPTTTTNNTPTINNANNNANSTTTTPPPRRYEADTQCSRGGIGMTEALRSKSICSFLGEVRIGFVVPHSNSSTTSNTTTSAVTTATDTSTLEEKDNDKLVQESKINKVMECWKNDLNSYNSNTTTNNNANDTSNNNGTTAQGHLYQSLRSIQNHRDLDRCKKRFHLIATRLASNYPWLSSNESKNETNTNNSNNPNTAERQPQTTEPVDNGTKSNVRKDGIGIKVRIQFKMDWNENLPLSLHLGSLHFASKIHHNNNVNNVSSPHVYTTNGIMGDHEGPRCWIPTIDSPLSKHRFSHELTVQVTSGWKEGLWVAGCGERFGVNCTVLHPYLSIPSRDGQNYDIHGSGDDQLNKKNQNSNSVVIDDNTSPSDCIMQGEENKEAIQDQNNESSHIRKKVEYMLGKSSIDFISECYSNNDIDYTVNKRQNSVYLESKYRHENMSNAVHIIPPETNSHDNVTSDLATSMWTTSVLSPCPSRSLGFAIGPFKVLYDPEYFSADDEDDEDGQEKDDDDEDDEVASIEETALKRGEGIRQLYFAPYHERCCIHSNSLVIDINDLDDIKKRILLDVPFCGGSSHATQSLNFKSRQMEMCLIGATTGVPNRALSLMRDILSLHSYRTSSYTQIWIPNAVGGGSSCGTLAACPEVSCNPFLGGAILDSKLLPPPGYRLPYFGGGRVLQFLQARCVIRGWIQAALPLGVKDEIGHGYIFTLFESLLMSLYEKVHGAWGEGGGKQSFFFSRRYAIGSGLNSRNIDFLPIVNVEDEDMMFDIPHGVGVLGSLPVEERNNDQLWRNAANGTESHTSALDEFSIRQLLVKDVLEGLERGDKAVPLPSNGWLGSHLCTTYLSSNSSSSSALGCGSLELVHPVGGMVYRMLKCASLRRIIEGRAGLSNFIRVMRAAFIAAMLKDKGETRVVLPKSTDKISKKKDSQRSIIDESRPKPPFILCVDEMMKKGGMTHGLFIRALRVISGPIREPYLQGTLVDVARDVYNPKLNKQLIEPEGFPNSFIRGSSGLYLRVGAHVEPATALNVDQSGAAPKGIHLHIAAEPVISESGIAFGGPVTLRIIENEGQCREFVRTIKSDGTRSDWGPIFLHAKPVTTAKQQTAASGAIELTGTSISKKSNNTDNADENTSDNIASTLLNTRNANTAFDENELHTGGYQALELVRITNLTPLLWVRVDPGGLYDGRLSLFLPDACLGEQLFHDGEAASQVEALRALAERPLRIQGSVKINVVYDVPVSELPVRLLSDCLRGSVALHADLPHNPAVRSHAALTIAQWQNNKAPDNKDTVGTDSWVGLKLLIQYFNERFFKNGSILPVRYSRVCLKMEKQQNHSSSGANAQVTTESEEYQYLDTYTEYSDRSTVIKEAVDAEQEEEEEYRVLSSVITAIACCRAKDGQTPSLVIRFLEQVLNSGEHAAMNYVSPQEAVLIRKKRRKLNHSDDYDHNKEKNTNYTNDYDQKHQNEQDDVCQYLDELPYISSYIIADTLLALCHIHVRPALIEDPVSGQQVQSKGEHPCTGLMEAAYRWLKWDLYKEDIRMESAHEFGGKCQSSISTCAISALCSLALLRQSTVINDPDSIKDETPSNKVVTQTSEDKMDLALNSNEDDNGDGNMKSKKRKSTSLHKVIEDSISSQFYQEIFDSKPHRADSTRAAAAQAIACICCAADRIEELSPEPLGLLTALEFLIERILDESTSPNLRHTLSALMLDACTGKVCSTRVALSSSSTNNDLLLFANKLYNGPLGASYGGDNGSALLNTISEMTMPAANAVNDGARRGLRLLNRAGQSNDLSEHSIVRVARFATLLWRSINGEMGGRDVMDVGTLSSSTVSSSYLSSCGFIPITSAVDGVCTHDVTLRCSLLALWQWIWPKGCIAVLRVQSWKEHEGTQRYRDLGADQVMKITDEERIAATAEDELCSSAIRDIVNYEIDRQRWRGGDMARVAYDHYNSVYALAAKDSTSNQTTAGLNQPLGIIKKDSAWKLGGWVSSTAHQRRAAGADGGSAVTKIRLTLKGND